MGNNIRSSSRPKALAPSIPMPPLADAMDAVHLSVDRFCLLAGVEALAEMMEEDATTVCGARHRRHGDRRGYRWGRTHSEIGYHGGKVKVARPRVRDRAGKEVSLESWQALRDGNLLLEWALNLMVLNVSTRKYHRAVRLPEGDLAKARGDGTSSSIRGQLSPYGGIRPAPRRRSKLALTLSEREEISRGLAAEQSARSLARLLGRAPSTVSREIRRNGGYDRYRAALSDEAAFIRARRPKRCKLAGNAQLRQTVARKLKQDWSPQQIAGWLKQMHPEDESKRGSHETIYRSLFIQSRGAFRKELTGYLRSKRTMRRSKRASSHGDGRGQITDIVSISERPASVEDRAVPGHWEGDLLAGSKNTHIATLVERHTRM